MSLLYKNNDPFNEGVEPVQLMRVMAMVSVCVIYLLYYSC